MTNFKTGINSTARVANQRLQTVEERAKATEEIAAVFAEIWTIVNKVVTNSRQISPHTQH